MKRSAWANYGLGLVLPLALIVLILSADAAEGPKTAYVGVLAVVPMLSAVFATPIVTAVVAVVTWLSAYGFGTVASDGNVAAQDVRLIIIAIVGVLAVGAAFLRQRRERALVAALHEAAAADQLRTQAETDALTGLANRRGLTARLDDLVDASQRTIALVDCDGLKAINDGMGHLNGDTYLQAVAGRLTGSLSKKDLIARWGGDEFIVVQQLDVDSAVTALQRMHGAIQSTPLSIDGTTVNATVSVGVAPWAAGQSFDAALVAADAALYEAKARGRNRIVVAGSSDH